jgi:IS5 family transposase
MLARTHRFEAMIKGSDAQRALADKAYASKANHAALRGKHRGGILQKTVRG